MKIKDRAKAKVPPVEAGVYMAVCIGLIDLGEQYSEKFKNYSYKVMYVWELPGETIEIDGEQKPRQEFMEFDVFDQVGKACQLNVVLNETKEYANVDNLMPIPKGFPAPTTATEHIKWDMDAWNDDVFAKLPEWIQEKIKKSTQYQKDHAPETEIKVDAATGEVCPI